jgi:hypothetical protein
MEGEISKSENVKMEHQMPVFSIFTFKAVADTMALTLQGGCTTYNFGKLGGNGCLTGPVVANFQ